MRVGMIQHRTLKRINKRTRKEPIKAPFTFSIISLILILKVNSMEVNNGISLAPRKIDRRKRQYKQEKLANQDQGDTPLVCVPCWIPEELLL